MSDALETFESLWFYCTAEKRLVPQPTLWNELYSKLHHTRRKPSGGWEPALAMMRKLLTGKTVLLKAQA